MGYNIYMLWITFIFIPLRVRNPYVLIAALVHVIFPDRHLDRKITGFRGFLAKSILLWRINGLKFVLGETIVLTG